MPLNQDGWSTFKKELHELFKENELGSDDPYKLSHVGSENPKLYPESGYSFGYCQGDIANNAEWERTFTELIKKPDNGLLPKEINDIIQKSKTEGDPTALKEYENRINDILRNAKDEIDAQYNKYLDKVIDRVNEVIKNAKPEYRQFLNRDEVKKFLCDYCNQYGISSNGPLEKLLTTGEAVIGLADDATRYHIRIDGDMGWCYLLALYFHTSQAQRTPGDPFRRFSNLIEQNGLRISDFNSPDRVFLFELQYYIGDAFSELYNKEDNIGFRTLYQSILADQSMRDSSPVLASISGLFDLAHGSFWARRDPVVFDLGGDGIQAIALEDSNAYFDLDGDGFRERTEWVSGQDGFLAVDENGNGRVDHIGELFGDEDPSFADGFAKLATFDSNGDSKIDAQDAVFSALRVWQDENENGATDEGELRTLPEAGIRAVHLNPSNGQSTFEFADGSQGAAGDRFFSVDQADSLYDGAAGDPLGEVDYTVESEILNLPWARGSGNVVDLPVAMRQNPALKSFMSDLVELADVAGLYNRMDDLLALWTGSEAIDSTGMRGAFSARKLAVLEKFMGRDFTMRINGVESFNAMGRGADYLSEAYGLLKDHLFGIIAVQTILSAKLSQARYDFFKDKIAFSVEGEDLVACLAGAANAAATEEKIFLGHIYRSLEAETGVALINLDAHLDEETRFLFNNLDRMILGTTGDDSLSGGKGSQVLVGFSGADTFSGGDGADRLYGGAGDDSLQGGDGNDVVEGGWGDDSIRDSNGDDTYLYRPGDGWDVIYDRGTVRSSLYYGMMRDGGDDTIRFGEGIAPDDVFFMLEEDDLKITFRDAPNDRITVTDWKKTYDYDAVPYTRIEHVAFADGTIYEVSDIFSRLGTDGSDSITLTDRGANLIDTGAGDDTVSTGRYGDYVNGGAGDDAISTGDGGDILVGGPGNDSLRGGGGNDIYEYGAGDGADNVYDRGSNKYGSIANGGDDTIRFGQGIAPDDVFFMLEGDDLKITFRDAPNDRITVTDWKKTYDYDAVPYTRIEHVAFADGTIYEASDIFSRLGTEGSDSITLTDRGANLIDTGAGDDTVTTGRYGDYVNGGAGDDAISTGNGGDILVGGPGNDSLRGGGGNDIYEYDAGDGADNIYDRGSTQYGSMANGGDDTLRFGEGIRAGDVYFALDGYNLIASLPDNPGDTITMSNWQKTYSFGSYPWTKIENIAFLDGTAFRIADVYSWRMGGEGNDTIQGGGRVDYINAGGGDDILSGGSGNDFLVGGFGSDTYRFSRGFGRDIINNDDDGNGRVDAIEFAEDIAADEVQASRVGDDLLLEMAATGDIVTVKNHFYKDGDNSRGIDEVRFSADGVVWSPETLKVHALEGTAGDDNLSGFATDDEIYGLEGDDSLYGRDGADVLIGGDGNDYIEGGSGSDYLEGNAGEDVIEAGPGSDILIGGTGDDLLNGGFGDDTYILQPGAGLDTLSDIGGIDTLALQGILPEEILIDSDGSNVVVTLPDGGSVVLTDWPTVENRIESILFADGQKLDIEAFLLPRVDSYELTLDEDTAADGIIDVAGVYGGIGYDILEETVHGAFTLYQDGSWHYRPEDQYFGEDQVKVTVENDFGQSAVSTIRFTVAPVNDAPVAADPVFSVDEDGALALAGPGLLAGAFDVDGDALCVDPLPASGPENGALVLSADGSFAYTPCENFNGIDGFAYTLEDGSGLSDTGHATIVVNAVNDPPVFESLPAAPCILQDVRTAEGRLAASDVDGDALAFSVKEGPAHGALVIDETGRWQYSAGGLFIGADNAKVELSDGSGGTAEAVLNFDIRVSPPDVEDLAVSLPEDGVASNRIVVINPSGGGVFFDVSKDAVNGIFVLEDDHRFTYMPHKDYNGTDAVTLTVTNAFGLSDTAMLTFDIEPVNDAPVAADPVFSVDEDGVLAVAGPGLLAGAFDVDGDALCVNPLPASGPENGALVLSADGSFAYTPCENFNGIDGFAYTLEDGSGLSDTGHVTIVVNAVNDPPVFQSVPTAPCILQDVRIAEGRLAASDVDGDALAFSVKEGPAHGALVIDETGRWQYAADDLFIGTDEAAVVVSDGHGGVGEAVLHFDVKVSPPKAEDLVLELEEDGQISGTLSAANPIGGSLAFSLVEAPRNGHLKIDEQSRWTYTPDADFNGTDGVRIAVTNAYGLADTAKIDFTVAPVNDAPTAPESLQYVLFAAADLSGKLSADDIDGDALTFSPVAAPRHGSFQIDNEGRWTYAPDENFAGEDGVKVAVTDGDGAKAETELFFNVNVFDGGSVVVGEGGTGTILMKGISKDDLTLIREQNDLFITVRERGSITLTGYFAAPESGVKQLQTLEGALYLDKETIAGADCGAWWRHWVNKIGRRGKKNLIYGSSRNDFLFGAGENDVLFGAGGKDRLFGAGGDDTLIGDRGRDRLYGGGGDDTLYGGDDKDFLYGGSGDDVLIGGDGKDRLCGGGGVDWLFGDSGNDRLQAGGGDDFLTGGKGNDRLEGDGGEDTYLFYAGDGSDAVCDRERSGRRRKTDENTDTVKFGGGISREDVAVFFRKGNLYLQYGDQDMVKIERQRRRNCGVERIELADGSYLTNADIEGIIQQMAAYAVKEGLCLHSVQDVRNNEELMTLIAGSWNGA